MNKRLLLVVCIMIQFSVLLQAVTVDSLAEPVTLKTGWKILEESESTIDQLSVESGSWQPVSIPGERY
jgi:hypothetical protein